MKATNAGQIIGKALQPYSGQGISKIIVLINNSWYDPNIQIASDGNFNITSVDSFITEFGIDMYNQAIDNGEISIGQGPIYFLTDALGQIKSSAASFSNLIVANIKTGYVSAKTISSDQISSLVATFDDLTSNKIYSPLVETNMLATDFISPLAKDSNIAVSLKNSKFEIKNGKNASNSATVASIDNEGNVYAEGNLTAQSATLSGSLTSQSASVAGTLTADKIIANEIEGLELKVATIAANYIKSNQNSRQNQTQNIPSLSPQQEDEFFNSFSTGNHDFINIGTISAKFALFHEGLVSFGPATFKDIAVIDNFSIGNKFLFTDNSLDVLGEDLAIQPLRQGGVDFFAGLIKFSSSGDIEIAGNANFAKNVTVKGTLAAGMLSPLVGDDLSVLLGNKQNGDGQFFAITDASKQNRLTINNQGDLHSSGSASFAQNIVASGSALLSKLNLFSQPAYAISENEEIATSSAGTSVLKANIREITISTPFVTSGSLIYITPVGDTANQVLYLERQVPGVSFTVGVSQSLNRNIQFNWIIIN